MMMVQLRKHFLTTIFVLVVVALSLLVLFGVHQLVLPIVAWVFPSLESTFYDLAVYGGYPTQSYVTSNLTSPSLNQVRWNERCDDGYIFVTPLGKSVTHPGPMILDSRGNLVWASHEFGTVMNLKVQKYKGQNYLTFWAGKKDSSFGSGAYHMLDSTYKEVYRIHAVGDNLRGDLHEFIISDDGTALFSVYNVTQADMTSMGRPVDGWINDSLFQEVDIETGELLFQWKASDHFSVADSFMTHPFAGYWQSIPFDFFHINSIQKDSHGNFLISSRHLHSLVSINSTTGHVQWVLGGRRNDFKDLSGGSATDFKWQHDGRWVSEEEGTLTLFDNSDAGILHMDAPYSTARLIKVDLANRTATQLHAYISLQQTRAASQGSVQIMPGSHDVFVGWGHSAAYSQYDMNGTLLCEAHLGASSLFFWGRVVSYRTQKTADWIGQPETAPTAQIQHGRLYVSWSGATEVKQWKLQGSNSLQLDDFKDVDIADKDEFEDSFNLPSEGYAHYRVAAVDRTGKVMRHSEIALDKTTTSVWKILLPLGGIIGLIGGIVVVYRSRKGGLNWKRYRYSRL